MALYMVVATAETPPPGDFTYRPSLIMMPSTKPFSSVRSPTAWLKLQMSPCWTTAPLISSTARAMLWVR